MFQNAVYTLWPECNIGALGFKFQLSSTHIVKVFGFVAHVLLIKLLPQKGFIATILAPSFPPSLPWAYTLCQIGHRFALRKGWLTFTEMVVFLFLTWLFNCTNYHVHPPPSAPTTLFLIGSKYLTTIVKFHLQI